MANEWNIGEQRKKGIKQEAEFALLVGVIHKSQTEELVEEYLDELEFLALTAGAVAVKRYTQKLVAPDSRTYIGKGKLEEIADYIERHEEISMVIFDDDLTGKQTNALEEALKVKIIDRSSLILDWARPQALPVIVLPGVGHFFHGQLSLLKNQVVQAWHR